MAGVQGTPQADAGSGRKRPRPRMAVAPEAERAPRDLMDFLGDRGAAAADAAAKLHQMEQALSIERTAKLTLEAEVARLKVSCSRWLSNTDAAH